MIDEGAARLKTKVAARALQITLNVTDDNGECMELHGATPSKYTARTWESDTQTP
jgi:hypothetical protein